MRLTLYLDSTILAARLRLSKLARVLVRLDHVASVIVHANPSIM